MDYATLVAPKSTAGSLQDRINYSSLPSAELVKNAQDEIFARLRVREMRKSLTITLAQGAFSAPLPDDYLDPEVILDQYSMEIKRIGDQRLLARRCYANGVLIQSIPCRFGVFDDLFQFDCAANAAMTLNGMYYAALYVDADTNTSFLTTRYSNLFWAVLQKFAYGYRKDMDAAKMWAAEVESLFEQIEQSDDLSYRGLDDDDAGGRL